MEEPSTPLYNLNPMVRGEQGRLLGEGSFGAVHVYTIPTGKFAVKTTKGLDPLSSVPLREAACMMRLNHPNVAKLLSAGIYNDTFYMTLQLASTTLYMYLSVLFMNEVTDETLKSLAYQFLVGVDYCLSRNVVHRDLKPNNLLITRLKTGVELTITDFGMARALGCVLGTGFTEEVTTLWYRAPEVVLGGPYNGDVDKWAVGCILYEIFKRTRIPIFEVTAQYDSDDSDSDDSDSDSSDGNDNGTKPTETDLLKGIVSLIGLPPRDVYGEFPKWYMVEDISDVSQQVQILSDEPAVDGMFRSLLVYTNRPSLRSIYKNSIFDSVRNAVSENYLPRDEILTCMDNLSLRALKAPKIIRGDLNEETSFNIKNWLIEFADEFYGDTKTIYHAITLFHLFVAKRRSSAENLKIIAGECFGLSIAYCRSFGGKIPYKDKITFGRVDSSEDQLKDMAIRISTELSFDFLFATAADFYLEYHRFYTFPTDGNDDFGNGIMKVMAVVDSIFTDTEPKIIALAAIYAKCIYYQQRFLHVDFVPQIVPVFNELMKVIVERPLEYFMNDEDLDVVVEKLNRPLLV